MTYLLGAGLVVALARLYTLVPRLGPTLVMLHFPGTAAHARSALDFVHAHRSEAWVARASIGAMAEAVGPLGSWALTGPQWTRALTWPLWLPGCVRGTVRGAVLVSRSRLRWEGEGT